MEFQDKSTQEGSASGPVSLEEYTETMEILSNSLKDNIYVKNNFEEIKKRFNTVTSLYPWSSILFRYDDGKIVASNRNSAELLGCHESGINGRSIFEFMDEQYILNIKRSVDANYFLKSREAIVKKLDGKYFQAAVFGMQINYDDSQLFLISVIDISEKKKQEEEKERLLEELQISRERIEEEAAKLVKLNIQLEESEEKLKELNAAKDKLFSIIGHDLKNPFFVISSYAELLNDEADDLSNEERQNFISAIGETSKFANRLLENLLHWARCQTGRIECSPEAIHLKKIIKNSVDLLGSLAQKKNISISVLVNPSFIANADKNMLDTILRNLISNAIKFTNENGTIKVTAAEENEFIRLSVSDSGIGLTESDKSKLFRIDVKNSEIGSAKEKGTGLGLILCKEFVERNGGTIGVESEVGVGSNFFFTVPKVIHNCCITV